jgi:hypothetical protein
MSIVPDVHSAFKKQRCSVLLDAVCHFVLPDKEGIIGTNSDTEKKNVDQDVDAPLQHLHLRLQQSVGRYISVLLFRSLCRCRFLYLEQSFW